MEYVSSNSQWQAIQQEAKQSPLSTRIRAQEARQTLDGTMAYADTRPEATVSFYDTLQSRSSN